MSNIVGEPFNRYVADQVLARQKIHGKANRPNDVLSYLNSRTAFIKLSSGVLVDDPNRLSNLGIPVSYAGSELAKNFILFSGVSDVNNKLFSGISRTETFVNNFTYGLGGLEMGLKPMPGISSIETKYRNRGSIRDGTIFLRAFNRKQFEIISLLYLRLGFPILLEWGHTIVVKNDETINTQPNYSISSDFLNSKFNNDNDVLNAIEAKRKESEGNYDAMYGRVANFDWSFTKNSSYEITLKIISVGAVVESLKMNAYTRDNIVVNSDKKDDIQPQSDLGWIIKYKNSHDIGKYFFNLSANKKGYDVNYYDTIATFRNQETNNIEFFRTQKENNYYIRLGTFLEFIQNNLILTSGNRVSQNNNLSKNIGLGFVENNKLALDKKNNLNLKSLINIDYDTFTNYCYTSAFQLSSDPRICLVGGFTIPEYSRTTINKSKKILNSELVYNPYKTKVNGVNVGFPMNIYVRFTLILNKLNDLKDNDGNVSFSDLINSILENINTALGGSNQLELVITDENIAKIIDSTPIPDSENLKPNLEQTNKSPIFNILGYYNNGTVDQSAGFIRDFSVKTEVTNNLATLLTIGATANGSVVGADGTAFSKWNSGLLPIINQYINYPNSVDIFKNSKTNIVDLITRVDKQSNNLVIDYFTYVNKFVDNSLSESELDNYKNIVANFIDHIQQIDNILNTLGPNKKASATSSRGFLPISLNIVMDGLSGIKIYQKIEVDTNFLPSDYPSSLKFIIKGVTQKVGDEGWLTSIETVSVPIIEFLIDSNKEGVTRSSPPIQNNDNKAQNRNNINAENLRKTLTELGYSEKGKAIDSSGNDITLNLEKAVSSLFRTIKKEQPQLSIIVTGGNDQFHQNLEGTSRHKKGNAIDFTVSPSISQNLDLVLNILRRYAAGNSPNFRFIDEYRHLTRNGTGNHFHLSWGVGTEGQTDLNTSLALAQQGKINPIIIA